MTRTRLAAAAVLTLGLLAPVAAASSASAAPQSCSAQVLVKDHKANKAKKAAKGTAKKNGHSRAAFVHAGKVSAVDAAAGTVSFVVRGGQNKAIRGCVLTVAVTANTKIHRNGDAATLGELAAGDHVNVKGTSAKVAGTSDVTYTATRIAAAGPKAAKS